MTFYTLDQDTGEIASVPPENFEEFLKKTKEESYHESRMVGRDALNDGAIIVSTYFTGMDERFSPADGPEPILFLTQVIDNGKDRGLLYDQEKHTNLKDAREGHLRMVEKWSRKDG